MIARAPRSPRFHAPVRATGSKNLMTIDLDDENDVGMMQDDSQRCHSPAREPANLKKTETCPSSPSDVQQFPYPRRLREIPKATPPSSKKKKLKKRLLNSIQPQDFVAAPPMSENESTTTKRSVRFDPWTIVHDTISRNEMTVDEKKDCWFQRCDFQRIRERNWCLIQRADDGEFEGKEDDDDDCCLRGLESSLEFEAEERQTVRQQALDWVLGEQEIHQIQQDEQGEDFDCYFETTIADVYAEITASCRYRAVNKAMEDYVIARPFCDEE